MNWRKDEWIGWYTVVQYTYTKCMDTYFRYITYLAFNVDTVDMREIENQTNFTTTTLTFFINSILEEET